MEGILVLIFVGSIFLALAFTAICRIVCDNWDYDWFLAIIGILLTIAILAAGILCCMGIANHYWPVV